MRWNPPEAGKTRMRTAFFTRAGKPINTHPGKSEFMIISKKTIMDPLPPLLQGDSALRYVSKTRLLGMTVDDNLTWVPHVLDPKKSFVSKLELLKRSRFLP